VAAKVLPSCGLSLPIELFARSVNLELPTTAPDIARNRLSFVTNSSPAGSSVPSPTSPAVGAASSFASLPLPSAPEDPSPGRYGGVQLTDGPRPPSIAGSSFFRIPIDERPTATGGQLAEEERLAQPVEVATSPAEPSGRLDLPPDFEEEFGHDHEPTPAYVEYDQGHANTV
jgi:hypothetical protein